MGLTNEQKLLILLRKAVENGYADDLNFTLKGFDGILRLRGYVFPTSLSMERDDNDYWSINDLVLNFESGKIDFVEALFTALIKEGLETEGSYVSQFKINFILLPTNQRLDYLFQTFNALLK